MMDTNIIIDDNYISEMGEYIFKKGMQLQNIMDEYLLIMKDCLNYGIVKGDTAEALSEFYVKMRYFKLIILETARDNKDILYQYLQKINDAEKYSFEEPL